MKLYNFIMNLRSQLSGKEKEKKNYHVCKCQQMIVVVKRGKDLVPRLVTDDDKHGTMPCFDTIFNESPDSFIYFLPHSLPYNQIFVC